MLCWRREKILSDRGGTTCRRSNSDWWSPTHNLDGLEKMVGRGTGRKKRRECVRPQQTVSSYRAVGAGQYIALKLCQRPLYLTFFSSDSTLCTSSPQSVATDWVFFVAAHSLDDKFCQSTGIFFWEIVSFFFCLTQLSLSPFVHRLNLRKFFSILT